MMLIASVSNMPEGARLPFVQRLIQPFHLNKIITVTALSPFYSIGHFINQPTNKTEFEITRFETVDEPDVDDLHKHTFYEIIWIEDGQSRQTDN